MIDIPKRAPLILGEQDLVETYEKGLRHFLKHMLDLDFDACFISDMSSLSDFYSRYGQYADGEGGVVEEYDQQILDQVYEKYGILFDKVTIPLVDMISEIEKVYDFDTDTKKQSTQH